MRRSFAEIFGADVHDIAADCPSRVQHQGLVLVDRVDVEFAFVHGSLVHGSWDCPVDEFAQ